LPDLLLFVLSLFPISLCSLCPCTSPAIVPLFFFTAPAPPDIYTLSLHDALPIFPGSWRRWRPCRRSRTRSRSTAVLPGRWRPARSEEHTSELQSRFDLVCRLLLEKKNIYAE